MLFPRHVKPEKSTEWMYTRSTLVPVTLAVTISSLSLANEPNAFFADLDTAVRDHIQYAQGIKVDTHEIHIILSYVIRIYINVSWELNS